MGIKYTLAVLAMMSLIALTAIKFIRVVLTARISKTVRFCRAGKLCWSEAWEWRSHDLAERKPSRLLAAKRLQSCYVKFARIPLIFIFSFNFAFNLHKLVISFELPI